MAWLPDRASYGASHMQSVTVLWCLGPEDLPFASEDNAASGELPSFDRLLRVYHKRVYNLAYRLLGDPDDAADLTQETFVKAYKAYPGFHGVPAAVYPWLCKIAVNGCKNRFKELGRRNRFEAFSLDEPVGDDSDLTFEAGDDTADPAGLFERQELEGKISRS